MKTFTLEQVEQALDENLGLCTHCGESQGNVEPDARKYKCESCGNDTVYGAEEIALMDLVETEE